MMDASESFSTSFSVVDVDTVMQNMRQQDESQFYTLVKMHLSFVLNFSVDEVDAPALPDDRSSESARKILPFGTKSKSKSSKGSGCGNVLSHEGVCQAYQLIEFLSREENLRQEGLFRKTGNIVRQQELKQFLLSGSSLDFESGLYSAHDCASVLKGFLANLSEPLLTKALYPAHCQVADICPVDTPADQLCAAHNKQIKALQLLFLLIPAENYQLLKDLLFLLYKVSKRHVENKMTALNLGTMFAPHILCPRKMPATELQTASGSMAQAVALMIENTPLLFKVPQELEIDMRAFLDRQPGTPGLRQRRRRRHSCSDVDSPQANTVFSFVDRQQSAAAGERDDTETALAGLYAHISSMPDSARRRKLIKQFNRESGAGTPTVAQRTRTRSFGESLRKHLFFAAGRQRKPSSKAGGGPAPHRSSSEEALASPPSPDGRPRYRQTSDEVSFCPTPSLAGPTLKRSLLTPTATARFTPRLARSLRQVQREGVPRGAAGAPPLPGSARRPDRTAEMSTFRAGRNNSMRRGQVPLRPVRVDGVAPPAGPTSPISQKMDTMSSSTRVQMLTPRNRRAVCLLSQTRLPSAAAGAAPQQTEASASTAAEEAPPPALSPVELQPLEDSPSGPKRARRASAGLSSPFCRYLLQRDMLTAEPVDLSLLEVASPPPDGRQADTTANRLLAGAVPLSDSLMDCLDGADPTAAAATTAEYGPASAPAGDGPTAGLAGDGQATAAGLGLSETAVKTELTAPTEESGGDVSADGAANDGCDDGYRSLTSSSSGASLPTGPDSPAGGGGRPALVDVSNQSTAADTSQISRIGLHALPEEWTEASTALPAEPSADGEENQRRKTLTDRDTNPMAHRKIGATRRRRSVLFETDL